MFPLDSKISEDSFFIGEFELCSVMLMNNSLFPWVVLVPKFADATEITDLPQELRSLLIEEIATMSQIMKDVYWPDKINVASLGNVVPQLHVHIIARFKTDDVWPEPVWGKGEKPYTNEGAREAVEIIRRECKKHENFLTIANTP